MTPAEHNEAQQPNLKAYLDNELPPWRRLAVRLHLARCAACREEMQAMQQIGNELREQTIDPLDPRLRSRILATVREMTPEPIARVPSRRPALVWGGTAFAALLLVAVFASRPQFGPEFQKAETPMPASEAPMADKAASSGALNAPATVPPPAPMASAKTANRAAAGSPVLDSPLPAPSRADTASTPMEFQSKSPQRERVKVEQPRSPATESSSRPTDSIASNFPQPSDTAGVRGSDAAKRAQPSPATPPSVRGMTSNRFSGGTFGASGGRGGEAFAAAPGSVASHGSSFAAARKAKALEPVALERAGFDLNGYQFVTQSGRRIAVPFKKSLNAVRFARATDGKMTLADSVSPPILYLAPADTLVNDAVPGARWQPLPPGFSAMQPLYVRPAPDWDAFAAMRWYPNMTVVGGLVYGDSADTSFTWLPGSHVQIGATLYPDFAAYRAFADAHPDALRLRAVHDSVEPLPSIPQGAKIPGAAAGSSRH